MLSPHTLPRRMSLTDTFFTLKPTLSPGRASLRASWCISTDFTSVVMFTGAKVTTMPGRRVPVSTRPTGTVPMPGPEEGGREGQAGQTGAPGPPWQAWAWPHGGSEGAGSPQTRQTHRGSHRDGGPDPRERKGLHKRPQNLSGGGRGKERPSGLGVPSLPPGEALGPSPLRLLLVRGAPLTHRNDPAQLQSPWHWTVPQGTLVPPLLMGLLTRVWLPTARGRLHPISLAVMEARVASQYDRHRLWLLLHR